MPIHILAGEEEFEISRAADALKEKLLDPAWSSFNFSRMEKGDLQSIIDAAATVPFGPGNKVVLVDRCDLFTKKRGQGDDADAHAGGKSDHGKGGSHRSEAGKSGKDRSARLLEDLDDALAQLSPNTHLIFACTANFDSSLKISKIFSRHAEPRSFEKKKYYAGSENAALVSWSQKEAHRYDAVIDDEAVFYLAESTEVNLRQMSKEIEKAATFIIPKKRITLEVVSTLSPHFSHVFALLDHWAAGSRGQVLESVQEILSRQSAIPVIAILQTTLSKWIDYKTAVEKICAGTPGGRDVRRREIPARDLANRLAPELKVNAFVLQLDLQRIKNLSLEFLVSKKRELTDLEYKVKTGQMPEAHALSVFLTR